MTPRCIPQLMQHSPQQPCRFRYPLTASPHPPSNPASPPFLHSSPSAPQRPKMCNYCDLIPTASTAVPPPLVPPPTLTNLPPPPGPPDPPHLLHKILLPPALPQPLHAIPLACTRVHRLLDASTRNPRRARNNPLRRCGGVRNCRKREGDGLGSEG